MIEDTPSQERLAINTESLTKLAIYLSGIRDGKGNLLPLGTIVLEDLWNAISYLEGSNLFYSKRDKQL